MINAYIQDRGRLRAVEKEAGDLTAAVWFDLMTPSADEESLVERVLGVNVPTREEMAGIGISSRLYYEDSAAFMTATLAAHTDGEEPVLAPVTFVLVEDRLVTVRYHEPQAFRIFPTPAAHAAAGAQDGATILVALLELEVDRLADVLERAGREINRPEQAPDPCAAAPLNPEQGEQRTAADGQDQVPEQVGPNGQTLHGGHHGNRRVSTDSP